jgi:hypothetical protein
MDRADLDFILGRKRETGVEMIGRHVKFSRACNERRITGHNGEAAYRRRGRKSQMFVQPNMAKSVAG